MDTHFVSDLRTDLAAYLDVHDEGAYRPDTQTWWALAILGTRSHLHSDVEETMAYWDIHTIYYILIERVKAVRHRASFFILRISAVRIILGVSLGRLLLVDTIRLAACIVLTIAMPKGERRRHAQPVSLMLSIARCFDLCPDAHAPFSSSAGSKCRASTFFLYST